VGLAFREKMAIVAKRHLLDTLTSLVKKSMVTTKMIIFETLMEIVKMITKMNFFKVKGAKHISNLYRARTERISHTLPKALKLRVASTKEFRDFNKTNNLN
jgi:hypothetical protein